MVEQITLGFMITLITRRLGLRRIRDLITRYGIR